MLHAVFSKVQVSRILAELLLVLGHFLQHLGQVPHGGLLASVHPLARGKVLQRPGDFLGHLCDVLVSQRNPQVIVLIQ